MRYDERYDLQQEAILAVVKETPLGDAILHGESKAQFSERVVDVRNKLLSLPEKFLYEDTAGKLLEIPEWPEMKVSERVFAFFMSLEGVHIFHAWQMALDCPEYDRGAHLVCGPNAYLFLRLLFPKVKFPKLWNSQGAQILACKLLQYARQQPQVSDSDGSFDVKALSLDPVKSRLFLAEPGLTAML